MVISICGVVLLAFGYDTTDFANAKALGCEGFTLLMTRANHDSQGSWLGSFRRGDESIDIIGHLE